MKSYQLIASVIVFFWVTIFVCNGFAFYKEFDRPQSCPEYKAIDDNWGNLINGKPLDWKEKKFELLAGNGEFRCADSSQPTLKTVQPDDSGKGVNVCEYRVKCKNKFTEAFIRISETSREKSERTESASEAEPGKSPTKRAKVDGDPSHLKICEGKRNFFFADKHLVDELKPHYCIEQSSDPCRIEVLERQNIRLLEAVERGWGLNAPYGRERHTEEFRDEDGKKRLISRAKGGVGSSRQDLVLNVIHFWQAPLKWQNEIIRFVNVGWFKFNRQADDGSCYWELEGVGMFGVHKEQYESTE